MDAHTQETRIVIGDLTIYLLDWKVTWKGRRISFTEKEIQILMCLGQHFNVPVRHRGILTFLYGDRTVYPRSLKVLISRIRKKLKDATGGDDYIETVRHHGYALRDPHSGP